MEKHKIVVKVLSWKNKRKRCFSLLLLSLLLSAAAVLVLLLLLLFFSVPLISRAFGEASEEPEVFSLFPRFFHLVLSVQNISLNMSLLALSSPLPHSSSPSSSLREETNRREAAISQRSVAL